MGGNYGILGFNKIKTFLIIAGLLMPLFFLQAQERMNAVGFYDAGRVAQAEENYYLAIEKYKAALALNPNYVDSMKGLAQCFFYLNEYEESLRYVALGKKYNQNDLELLALEGKLWIVLGDLNKAKSIFNLILTREPNNIEAIAGIALLDIAGGRTALAAKQFEEALRVSPSHRQALLALAIINQELKNFTASERYLELALKYHSNDALVHYVAGKYFYARKDFEKAGHYLETALGLNAHYVAARELLGKIYLAKKDYKRAAEILESVPANNPLYFLARYTMGRAYAAQGDIDNAIRNFNKVLAVRPDDEVARIAQENLIIDSNLPEKDERRLPLSAERLRRGELFEAKYMFNMALLEYRICLMLDNASPNAKKGRYEMARIYKTKGFPMKYLEELKVIKDKMKVSNPPQDELDRIINNDIERYEYKKKELLNSKWQRDQYKNGSTGLKFALFNLKPQNYETHPEAGSELTRFFHSILFLYEKKIDVVVRRDISAFEEAFRLARDSYTDYFLIISFHEEERSITVEGGLYLSRSGTLLYTFKLSRTGNDRVQSVLVSLGERLNTLIPLKGKILDRRFDQAIIDLGSMHDLKKDDKLIILKKGTANLHNNRVGFKYADSDVVGDFTVTALDEAIAEGSLKRKGYYDLINIGDEVIFEPAGVEDKEKVSSSTAGELLRNLMELR